jgi:acetyl-CoA acetyltransferase
MSDIVIVGAKRTAIGSFQGQFKSVSPHRPSALPPSRRRSSTPVSRPTPVTR